MKSKIALIHQYTYLYFQMSLPANTKTPINHITPIKTIAPGSSWPGLGFFPILTAVLSPT